MRNIKKKNKYEKEMIKFLKTNCYELESISNERTKSMLDMYKYGKGFFYESDWKDKVLAHYNFFISMIGFTEAFIIDTSNKIANENNSNHLNDLIESLEYLMKKRQKIVNTYLNIELDNDLPIVREILKQPFLYNELNKIYADLEVGNTKYQLHQAFVHSYNKGSMLANKCDFETIYYKYNHLLLAYSQTKNDNESKLNKINSSKQFKKIIRDKNRISKEREN